MKTTFVLRNQTARPVIYIAWLALALIALPPSGSIARAADNPNLAGTWKLNQNQSDNPREKMREAMGSAGPDGQGGGPGGGFGNRGGRGRGRGGNMFQNQSQLTIEQNGQSVKISDESGDLIAETSDNNSNNNNANDQDNSAQSSNSDQSNGQRFRGRRRGPQIAQWKNNQLLIENSGPNGGKTTRTYSLSPDGKQLYVTTEMQNPRFDQPVTFRLVYDSVKSE